MVNRCGTGFPIANLERQFASADVRTWQDRLVSYEQSLKELKVALPGLSRVNRIAVIVDGLTRDCKYLKGSLNRQERSYIADFEHRLKAAQWVQKITSYRKELEEILNDIHGDLSDPATIAARIEAVRHRLTEDCEELGNNGISPSRRSCITELHEQVEAHKKLLDRKTELKRLLQHAFLDSDIDAVEERAHSISKEALAEVQRLSPKEHGINATLKRGFENRELEASWIVRLIFYGRLIYRLEQSACDALDETGSMAEEIAIVTQDITADIVKIERGSSKEIICTVMIYLQDYHNHLTWIQELVACKKEFARLNCSILDATPDLSGKNALNDFIQHVTDCKIIGQHLDILARQFDSLLVNALCLRQDMAVSCSRDGAESDAFF